MSVQLTIELTQTIETLEGVPVYRVAIAAVASDGIEMDVFVFDVETQYYSRVATIYDMHSYPVQEQAAIDAGLSYYRHRMFEASFASAAEATYFTNVVQSRLQTLVADTENISVAFVTGTQTLTFSSVGD